MKAYNPYLHFCRFAQKLLIRPTAASTQAFRILRRRRCAVARAIMPPNMCVVASLRQVIAEIPESPTDNDDIVGPYLPGMALFSPRRIVSLPAGTSYQVNVSAGQNVAGDAANEASMCIDPNNPNRIAIAWRQFDSTNSNFRQAGYAYSTNGGVDWTTGGTLQTNVFRSDPVLASDAEGRFYYLSLNDPNTFTCDIWRSTNGGASWQLIGPAAGGDKEWFTIDTTAGPGHGTIYQDWDLSSPTGSRDFSLSRDGGLTWSNPVVIPQTPYFGTPDVGATGGRIGR